MAEHRPWWFLPPPAPPHVVSKTRLRHDEEGKPRSICRTGGALLLMGIIACTGGWVTDIAAQPRRERPPEEQPGEYPQGPNRDDTFYFCTACHGFKIVAAQGMSRERWSETFDFMVSRHKMVDLQGEQRERMLDYLSTAFPERTQPGGWKNPFAVK
jgi:hypothetical protein